MLPSVWPLIRRIIAPEGINVGQCLAGVFTGQPGQYVRSCYPPCLSRESACAHPEMVARCRLPRPAGRRPRGTSKRLPRRKVARLCALLAVKWTLGFPWQLAPSPRCTGPDAVSPVSSQSRLYSNRPLDDFGVPPISSRSCAHNSLLSFELPGRANPPDPPQAPPPGRTVIPRCTTRIATCNNVIQSCWR